MNETEISELIQRGLVICRVRKRSHPFGIFYGENPLAYSFPLLLFEVSSLIIIFRFLHFLLQPLRQPKVVSSILGGIILGPSVLSQNKRFQAYVFPDNAVYVIQNLGVIGFMYFIFITAVKMDITIIRKVGKKHWCIALVGIVVPLCCSLAMALTVRKSLEIETAKLSSIWGITSSLSITAFPVLHPIIKELNLLSSEMGKMALSMSVVSDLIGMNGVLIFEASKQAEGEPIAALWSSISFFLLVGVIFCVLRPLFLWIVRTTPEGKQVKEYYVTGILLGVMVSGFIADFLGLAIVNGPLWLGLAIPDGPPLGSILVEKSETIVTEFLMPFSFMFVGMIVDVSSITGNWSHLEPLLLVILVTYTIKVFSTLVASRLCDISVRDSLTLSLIMNLRGEVEILLFMHWMDFQMIGQPQFTILVMLSVGMTSLATPLISLLYDPTRPYMLNRRRNIQHRVPNTELGIVICIHGEENLSGIMKLLRVSNPTINNRFSIHALRLIELVARANPVFIDHDKVFHSFNFSSIRRALMIFEETMGESINIHSYTTISPKRTWHQDICELALLKKASLIILPYQNQLVNTNVLEHAPCSVGLLVDKRPFQNVVGGFLRYSIHHVVVLFLGGPDAREALTYADMMATNPDILLTVIRFLSHENEGENEMEKKLDDGLVTWFWVKNEANDRIIYREVVVNSGEETISAIRAMNDSPYDLWIVGRKNGINPVLLEGLSHWSENNELGVIGDLVASTDFGNTASVLAVQQQVLREMASGSLLGRFSLCKK